jgi:hypothetical protein
MNIGRCSRSAARISRDASWGAAMPGQLQRHGDPAWLDDRAAGHDVSIERVPYEFQRGGNEMMRIRRA